MRKVNQRWEGHFWQRENVQSMFKGPVVKRDITFKKN
jgi:hypothetical protein